jgi:hypothetical protein
VKRDVPKDQPIQFRDVEFPRDRLCDNLRAEQTGYFDEKRPAVAGVRLGWNDLEPCLAARSLRPVGSCRMGAPRGAAFLPRGHG